MAEPPEPMTSPECDLRGMPYMPLDLVTLFDSDLYALSTGDEFKAALTLWGKSFYQVPAGSLPSDDRLLEHLSGSRKWKAVRDMAMRGWVKCSDGRLYHRTVAQKVKEAWDSRLARRERTEAARAARHNAKATSNSGGTPPVTVSVTENATEPVAENVTTFATGSKGTEQNRREEKKEERADASHPATADAAPPQPPDVRTEFWRDGLGILRRLTGKAEGTSRAFLGRMLKAEALGDDCDAALAVLHEAENLRPGDPEAWIMAACKARSSRAVTGISARKEAILRAGGMWPPSETTIEHEPQPGRLLQ